MDASQNEIEKYLGVFHAPKKKARARERRAKEKTQRESDRLVLISSGRLSRREQAIVGSLNNGWMSIARLAKVLRRHSDWKRPDGERMKLQAIGRRLADIAKQGRPWLEIKVEPHPKGARMYFLRLRDQIS